MEMMSYCLIYLEDEFKGDGLINSVYIGASIISRLIGSLKHQITSCSLEARQRSLHCRREKAHHTVGNAVGLEMLSIYIHSEVCTSFEVYRTSGGP